MKPMHEIQINASQHKKNQTYDYSSNTVTLPYEIQGQQVKLPVLEWVNKMFQDSFTHKWNKKELPAVWRRMLSQLNTEQIFNTTLWYTDNEGWPPSSGEFKAKALDNGIDYDESFDRFINARTQEDKNNLSDIEYFTAQEIGDRCRTRLSEDKARALWKKTQAKYAKRAQEGTLPNRQQKAIAHTKKTVGKWEAPNGRLYDCPAIYYKEMMENKNAK